MLKSKGEPAKSKKPRKMAGLKRYIINDIVIVANIYLNFVERSGQEHSEIEWEKPVPPTSKKTREFYKVNA